MPAWSVAVSRWKADGRFMAFQTLAALALALLLAGCGAAVSPAGGAPGSAPTATARAIATASAGPTACPESGQDAGHPALVLTPVTPNRSGDAHVGDLVQVRLPITSKWTYQPAQASNVLTPAQPSGVLIHSLNACVWSFTAVAPGSETLTFIGQPICKPGEPCPAYRIATTFSVNVL